ncbi:MAG: polar localization protein TipN [Caulobacteraceae bacterium]
MPTPPQGSAPAGVAEEQSSAAAAAAPELAPSEPAHPAPAVTDAPFAPAVTASRDRLPARKSDKAPAASGSQFYGLATALTLLWAAGLAAFVFGYQTRSGPFELDAFTFGILGALAIVPAGFLFAAAYVAAEGRKLAAESRRTQDLADSLLTPAAIAAAQAGSLIESLRNQIGTTGEAADQAREHLLALREALAIETERLVDATAKSAQTAQGLAQNLGQERAEMNALAVTLDVRSAAVADAIRRQAQMVKEAADLADAQLREGQATLAGGAADLAAAASEAVDAAQAAGGELSRQITRLETAGSGVSEQMRSVEEGLTQQRAALVTVAHALRADQEDFAALAETRGAQLAEFIANARIDAAHLGESAQKGAEHLSQLVAQAAVQFTDLTESAREQRELFSTSAAQSLDEMAAIGEREREALREQMRQTAEALGAAATEAREAADVHAEAARARVEQLNEAAFTAGLKADQIFEARLNEARALIDQSAKLVEEAGARTADRLEAGVEAAKSNLADLQVMLEEIRARSESLPEQAKARSDEVQQAVEKGMEDLMASARRAAAETQAIDQAFQERIRRNYEMLSEAVQLMGVVAGNASAAAPSLARGPLPPRAPLTPKPAESAQPAAPETPAAPPPATNDDAGRANRLKLTPTATDDEFKAIFEGASGQTPPPGQDDGWTWKQLLGGMEGEAADAGLGERLVGDVEGMGIDPAALLPRARIEEISAVVQTGDGGGAREVVRALAPAAIRRLARKMLADPQFGARISTFTRHYGEIIDEAADRDPAGAEVATLLATPTGRVFLLLDAATGYRG